MTDHIDWPQLARYVTDAATPEERRAIEAWIAADPANEAAVASARRVWEGAAPEADSWNVQAAWRELERKEAATREPAVVRPIRPLPMFAAAPSRGRWPAVARWAAAAAIVLAAGAGVLWRAKGDAPRAPNASVALRAVSTTPGQRLDLRMPDGTRVVLGVASTLRYASTYGATSRDVYLEGEAYFEVAHDETKPFAVHAGDAVARDLGTRFNVRAYADERAVAVVVAEGVVEVSAKGAPSAAARLTAGQLAQVNRAGQVLVERGVAVDRYLAWTKGELVFQNARLQDALPQLARWYDLDFKLGDSALGERRISGTFGEDAVPDVLRFLALSVNARYERDGRTITLAPARGRP